MPVKNDVRFQQWCDLLQKYIQKNHRFPSHRDEFEGAKLGQWLNNQVNFYRAGKISEERIQLLNSVHPAWNGGKEARKAAHIELLLASDWKSKIPEGHTPITPFFKKPDNIAACLSAGIYDLEGFVSYCEDKIPFEWSEEEDSWTGPFTRKNRDAAFIELFPTLTYNGVVFQAMLCGVDLPPLEYAKELVNNTRLAYTNQSAIFARVLPTNRNGKVLAYHYGLLGTVPFSYKFLAKKWACPEEKVEAWARSSLRSVRRTSTIQSLTNLGIVGKHVRSVPDFGPIGAVSEVFKDWVCSFLIQRGILYVDQLHGLSPEQADEVFCSIPVNKPESILKTAEEYAITDEILQNREAYQLFWENAGVYGGIDHCEEEAAALLKQAYQLGFTPKEMQILSEPDGFASLSDMEFTAKVIWKMHTYELNFPERVFSASQEEASTNKHVSLDDLIRSAASRKGSPPPGGGGPGGRDGH